MFVLRDTEQGMAALADEAMISGMVVSVRQGSDGQMHVKKVTSSGDLAGRCGIAYVDQTKKINLRPHFIDDASLTTGNLAEKIAANDFVTVLYGDIRGMTNQLEDGYYNPGDKLTVNTTTARFQAAGSGDKVYAAISLNHRSQLAVGQNVVAPVLIELGGQVETNPTA